MRPTPRTTRSARRRRWVVLVVFSLLLVSAAAVSAILLRTRAARPAATPPPESQPLVIPAVEPAPRPTTIVRFEQGCMTAECHATLATGATVHEPTVEHKCATCHLPDETGAHVFPIVAGGPGDLCSSCHDTGSDRPIHHAAAEAGACLACHTPHASAGPHLLAAGSVDSTCAYCHPRSTGISQHPMYKDGDCSACHDPHGSEAAGLLIGGAGREHCGVCHAPIANEVSHARHAHRDLERDCLACHAAHTAGFPALLTAAAGDQCLACHEDIRTAITTARVAHDPVISGDHCVSCHNPHASDNAAMLRDDQASVCLSCHDEQVKTSTGRIVRNMAEVIRSAPFMHGPVASGNCAACHPVHGAQHERLLAEVNPAVITGDFDMHSYTLCFTCHDQNMAMEETTVVSTGFRNGDVNLHFAHLRAKGSRGCADCHAIHAGDAPHLIAREVAYQGSDWMMPMEFMPTVNGGSCAPGCHEPLSYSRTAPARPAREAGDAP